MSATKIFIDTSEDVAFATDKIRNADSRKVILVVNNGANITTTQVSLKLLAKMILKTDKLVVLVTEDPQAQTYAQKAGIVHVNKISEVTKEIWDDVNNSKQGQLIKIDQKKVELINSRQSSDHGSNHEEPEAEKNTEVIDELAPVETIESNEAGDLVTGIADSFAESALEDGGLEIFNPELETDNTLLELKDGSEDEVYIDQSQATEPISLFTKLEPKLIELDGYTILSGGDITVEHELADHLSKKLHFQQVLSKKKSRDLEAEVEGEPAEEEVITAMPVQKPMQSTSHLRADLGAKAANLSHMAGDNIRHFANNIFKHKRNIPNTPAPTQASAQASFTNRNFRGIDNPNHLDTNSRVSHRRRAQKSSPIGRFAGNAQIAEKAKHFINTAKDNLHKIKGNKLAVYAIVVGLIAMFLIYTFAISPSSEIVVVVAANSIPISETITADQDTTSIDTAALKIPLSKRSETESRSETVEATGKGEDGSAAATSVTIMNKDNSPANLLAGTVLSQVGKQGFDFKLQNSVTIAAEGVAKNVPISAVNIGEKYNQESNAKKDFTIANRENISIFTYSAIAGGKKDQITVVSEDDIKNAKDNLANVLKNSLETKINNLTATSETLLNKKISFSEAKVNATKKVGDKADSFDLDVELTATAYIISNDDLTVLAEELSKKNSGIQGETRVSNLETPVIENVKIKDGVATFNLVSNATVSAALTEDTIKGEVLGVSTSTAKDNLSQLPDVKEVKISFAPGYIPNFLRTIPKSEDRVTVTISKSESVDSD